MEVMKIIKTNDFGVLDNHNFYITSNKVMRKLCNAKLLQSLEKITYITYITSPMKVQPDSPLRSNGKHVLWTFHMIQQLQGLETAIIADNKREIASTAPCLFTTMD